MFQNWPLFIFCWSILTAQSHLFCWCVYSLLHRSVGVKELMQFESNWGMITLSLLSLMFSYHSRQHISSADPLLLHIYQCLCFRKIMFKSMKFSWIHLALQFRDYFIVIPNVKFPSISMIYIKVLQVCQMRHYTISLLSWVTSILLWKEEE